MSASKNSGGFSRSVQCKACPWKTSTDPHKDIPGGYDAEKHARLVKCQSNGMSTGTIMACHESQPGKEYACVGWLINQLGPGNNIGLRLAAAFGRFDASKLKTKGEQYETIEEMCAAGSR